MTQYKLATPEGIQPAFKWDRFEEPGDGGRRYIEVVTPNDEIAVARLTWNDTDKSMDFVGYGHPVSSKVIDWLFQIAPAAIG